MFGVATLFFFFVTFACIARANSKLADLEEKLSGAAKAAEV